MCNSASRYFAFTILLCIGLSGEAADDRLESAKNLSISYIDYYGQPIESSQIRVLSGNHIVAKHTDIQVLAFNMLADRVFVGDMNFYNGKQSELLQKSLFN